MTATPVQSSLENAHVILRNLPTGDEYWDGKVKLLAVDVATLEWVSVTTAMLIGTAVGGGGDASAANQIITNAKLDSLIAAMTALTDNIDIKINQAALVIDCAVTNLNGSAGALVQIEAATTAKASQIIIDDGVGQSIGIYAGAIGLETLVAVVGGGAPDHQAVDIPVATRLSARSLKTTGVTAGEFTLIRMGPQ